MNFTDDMRFSKKRAIVYTSAHATEVHHHSLFEIDINAYSKDYIQQ